MLRLASLVGACVMLALADGTMLANAQTPGAGTAAGQPAHSPAPSARDAAGVAEPQPPEKLPAGSVVYRTLTGREAQVTFTSDAPLERIVGKSNAVMGYAIAGPADAPAKLVGATWVLPVRSLATGLPLRDEHIAARDWLDAEAHPAIQFVLTRIDDLKEVKKGDGFETWSGTLVGQMSLHGTTREIRVPDARLSFLKASEKTRSIAPGDLLFLKCDYTVKLSDFGVRNGDVPSKVSDEVVLSQMLRMTTADPRSSPPPAPAGGVTDPGR